MKILVANNYYYLRGGSERVMFDEAKILEAATHQVIPFSRLHPQNLTTTYDKYFLSIVDYEHACGFQKVRVVPEIIYSGKQKNAMSKLIEDVKPTLIHGHNIYGGLTFSIVDAAHKKGIPFVLTLHDFKLICPSYLLLNHGEICERCLGRRFWNCAIQRCHKNSLPASMVYMTEAYFNSYAGKYNHISKFICPSHFILDKHAAGGFPREKLTYLPNALDPTLYAPSFEAGDYVLFVGRLSKEKGVLTLLQAFRHLNIPLQIAGTGPIEKTARQYAEKHSMKHVVFEGYQSGARLQQLYRQAAFLVIPSESHENAPMSILESFAYGKPVVGSNLGGIPELVIPQNTGFLYESGSVEELTNRIEKLWQDKKTIRDLGIKARDRIEKEFSIEKHVESLLEIYRSATGER